MQALIELGLFTAKSTIIVAMILIVLVVFFMLLAKGKQRPGGQLTIKNLNERFEEQADIIQSETLMKKELKKLHKEKCAAAKAEKKSDVPAKKIYVLHFDGDIKASAVSGLREEISAILNVAQPGDEVFLSLESGGGMVHGYGLAAAQLMRLRAKQIPLTIAIDKVAASGGYMMACIANKILAAPFAIVGSIGVIVQLPNFHRLLKDKHIDFEQHTAGEFKRTITMFGQNTDEDREKLQEEIEKLHQLFKNLIVQYRPQIDIQKVATGEHWAAIQAIDFKLVDEIKTSDEYLLEQSRHAKLYALRYEVKKPFLARLTATANSMRQRWLLSKMNIL